MPEMFDHGSTSTWDDWVVMRSDTGDQYADGMARALLDPNFTLEVLDFGAEGTRGGLRKLFAEFETATAGQPIRGRSMMGWKRRAPDQWRVDTDPTNGAVTLTFGADTEPGVFVAMSVPTATAFVRDVVDALEKLNGGDSTA